MRVLKFLVMALVILGSVAAVGWLIGREVMIRVAMAELRSAVSEMRQISVKSGSYIRECRLKGVSDDDPQPLQAIQLRFLSNTEYVIEVVCSQFPLSPIEVRRKTLPPLVTKVPGGSGIVWGAQRSGVMLELLGRRRAIIVEAESVLYDSSPTAELGIGPLTSCAGQGFSCCQLETAEGKGAQSTAATDCPRTCYQRCQPRPVVLSFTTEPYYDVQSRTLEVKAGEPVNFNYVVDIPGKQTATVSVQFGDGQSEQLTTTTGTTSHVYQCAQATCTYTATVQATAADGGTAAVTTVSQVTILVTP